MKAWRGHGWAIVKKGELVIRPEFIKPHVAFTKKGAEAWMWEDGQEVVRVEVTIRKRRA